MLVNLHSSELKIPICPKHRLLIFSELQHIKMNQILKRETRYKSLKLTTPHKDFQCCGIAILAISNVFDVSIFKVNI